jgi:hypothetical protein
MRAHSHGIFPTSCVFFVDNKRFYNINSTKLIVMLHIASSQIPLLRLMGNGGCDSDMSIHDNKYYWIPGELV